MGEEDSRDDERSRTALTQQKLNRTQHPGLEKGCLWENRTERYKILRGGEKVSREQSLSICLSRRAKSRQCEIIRQPETSFSYCIAHCHMMLWEPYGTAQTEMRQTRRREFALLGTKQW